MATTNAQGGLRAWAMWFIGAFAVAVTLLSRTSFGAAGGYAAERFEIGTGLLSIFIVVQMVIYSLMQMPAGQVLDRLGSRTSLAIGFSIIFLGQFALAFTDQIVLGVAERAVIAVGDSLIWMSAIRIIPEWFPAPRVPLLTQLTYVLGQAGQWASAVPFIWILSDHGWTAALLVVAICCLVIILVDLLFLHDSRTVKNLRGVPAKQAGPGGGMRAVLRNPGARLGFSIHMATSFSPIVFTLMWGYSYLEQGHGLARETAGNLFTIFVIAAVIWSPLIGLLSNRFGDRRVQLALGFSALLAFSWVVVLLWPGETPIWVLAGLVVIMSSGFPASNIAFDINRTYVPIRDTGKGSGMVVMGGFLMAMVLVLAIGVIAELLGGTKQAWRIAMATQIIGWAVAWTMSIHFLGKVRRELGEVKPV